MINKRLLIKNLLAHHDENSFYDKKRQLNLHTKEGKAKFLKHICALSNSNFSNNSYIVVGVEDETNDIVGDDFFDDSRIQNLVNAYLENPPKIQYENVPFPNLPKDKVVGLVTIKPNGKVSSFKKNIHTIISPTVFIRHGSNSIPTTEKIPFTKQNLELVKSIEINSRTNIEQTLQSVIDFVTISHKNLNYNFNVFRELFVVCWAGNKKRVKDKIFYSRVDVELINEQVKLFYSTLDEVTIEFDSESFTITEYVQLGLNDKTSYYPFERVKLTFFDNGYYKIETVFLFEPPQFNKHLLFHVYNAAVSLLNKLAKSTPLTKQNEKDLIYLPATLMLCYFNGFEHAKQLLIDSKMTFKQHPNSEVYIAFKEAMRILRKMKYNTAEKNLIPIQNK